MKQNAIKTAKDAYAQWLAYPPLLRRLNRVEVENLGLEVEEDNFLLIKTREELSKKLKTSRSQLWRYEQEEEFQKEVRKYEKEWGGKRTPNIMLGLYRAAVKEGDAPRAKLWFQLFRDWEEKQKLNLESEDLKNLTASIIKITDSWKAKKHDPKRNTGGDGDHSKTDRGSQATG